MFISHKNPRNTHGRSSLVAALAHNPSFHVKVMTSAVIVVFDEL